MAIAHIYSVRALVMVAFFDSCSVRALAMVAFFDSYSVRALAMVAFFDMFLVVEGRKVLQQGLIPAAVPTT